MSAVEERDLTKQFADISHVILALKDLVGDEDQDLLADTYEGETGFMEIIDKTVSMVDEEESSVEAIAQQIKRLEARKTRRKQKAERLRNFILSAMVDAGLTSINRPAATISLAKARPKLVVADEAQIPAKFWVPQPPKLDRKTCLSAINDNGKVPGCSLSNGGPSLNIRRV